MADHVKPLSHEDAEVHRDAAENAAQHPGELREKIAKALFNFDYYGEWGDLSNFWFEERAEEYRDRASLVLNLVRQASSDALARTQ